MALIICPYCGSPVSTTATNCQLCGRPIESATQITKLSKNKCKHCGSSNVGRVRGLQGVDEVIIFIILFCVFIIPGIIYYIATESRPFCTGCGKRL